MDALKNLTIYWTTNATEGVSCSIWIVQVSSHFVQELAGASNVSLWDGRVTLPPMGEHVTNGDGYKLAFKNPDYENKFTWYAYSDAFSISNAASDGQATATSSLPFPTSTDGLPSGARPLPTFSDTADSSHSGLSDGAKTGIGVGVGIGFPLLVAVAGALFFFSRKGRHTPVPQHVVDYSPPAPPYADATGPAEVDAWITQQKPAKDKPVELASGPKIAHEMPA